MLEITVKTLDSNNHSFTLVDEATVLQLKESILEKIQVPVAAQRLIYQGKVLVNEKKLTDYGDVNGKVLHLVERPPPRPEHASDSTSNFNPGRRYSLRREGPQTFIGSMSMPTIGFGHHDVLEGMDIPVRPSQMMARNRLDCASRMLGYALQTIRMMADPNYQPPRQSRRSAGNRVAPSAPPASNHGNSPSQPAPSVEQPQSNGLENSGSIAMVAADIAMIAEVLTGQVASTINRQRPAEGQRREGAPPDVVTPATYNEDIASEVEISDSGSSETDAATEVRDNSTESRPTGTRPERPDNRARVDAMVPLLSELESINAELAPYLARCRELLSSDTTFDENSNPTQREATRIFTGVTEALHSISHAAHALSDLMVDFNEDAPRFLRCRPVVLQHSTIVEAGVPFAVPMEEFFQNVMEENRRNPTATAPPVPGNNPPGFPPGSSSTNTTIPIIPPPIRTTSTGVPTPTAQTVADVLANGPPRAPRGMFPAVEIQRLDALPTLEVFLDYRRPDRNGAPASTTTTTTAPPVAGAQPATQAPGGPADFDASRLTGFEMLAGQIRNQILGSLTGENAPNPLAAQAAALASTANLWPNSGNGETETDDTLPVIRSTELDAVLNSYPPWLPRPGNSSNTTSTGTNAAPEQTATGSQTTPPRRVGVPPMISMMNMIFQQNFDPALPCSSHHIRGQRRPMPSNRMRWEMLQPMEPSRFLARRGATRRGPEGGNANQEEPTPEQSRNASVNLPRFIADFVRQESSMTLRPETFVQSMTAAVTPSLFHNFFGTMLQYLSPTDLNNLAAARYSTLVTRLRPALRDFVTRYLLHDETLSPEALNRACDRILFGLRPYIDTMQETSLLPTVDLLATINNYNRRFLPEIITLIISPDSGPIDFGDELVARFSRYLRQLIAIIIHCCTDRPEDFAIVIRNMVRILLTDAPHSVLRWMERHSVENMCMYAEGLNIPLEQIQEFIVHFEDHDPTVAEPHAQEPMETDGANNVHSLRREYLNTENLPEVILGTESWHSAVPSEWVPVIARDTQRQRRQSAQKPVSDAYMSGMPPKRRKLIAASKPQGESLSQAISENLRQAIQAAGVSSPAAERAIADAAHDRSLQKAFKIQETSTVAPIISDNPDFNPSRFPNAHNFFKK